MKALQRDIEKQKAKLIAKASKKGIYENFGQKEVRDLEEKHIDISDYMDEMNEKRKEVLDFDDWCMDYCG